MKAIIFVLIPFKSGQRSEDFVVMGAGAEKAS